MERLPRVGRVGSHLGEGAEGGGEVGLAVVRMAALGC